MYLSHLWIYSFKAYAWSTHGLQAVQSKLTRVVPLACTFTETWGKFIK